MASIELHCTICPSKPKFSDQSHLLTHIGSKGHLSHYFKSQVRARQDDDARESLREYDAWYERNKIEELLSDRLKAKDNKQVPRRLPPPAKKDLVPKKRASRKKANTQALIDSDYDLQAGPVIDPSLETHQLLPAPQALGQSCRAPSKPQAVNDRRAPIAHMSAADENVDTRANGKRVSNTRGGQMPSRNTPTYVSKGRGGTNTYPLTPTVSASQLNPSPLRLQASPTDSGTSASTSSDTTPKQQQVHVPYQPGDSAILKGIIWPGMDLFDTADADSRRKRNQKKDASTLLQMQLESETFEPTEVIYFYPSWDLKRARYISGEVESSPEPEIEEFGVSPKPDERRAPLAELDANVQATRRVRSRKVAVSNTASKSFATGYNDIDPDLEMTLGTKRKKTGRGFQVYKDSPVKAEPRHDADNLSSRSTNAFAHDGANRPTFETNGYFDQVYQPQPLSTEHVSFLDGTNFYDRPTLTTSHVRGSNVFRMDGYQSQNQNQNQPFGSDNRMYSRTADTSQRFFTTENPDMVQFRTSMPTHMDMAIAYGSHHSPNPFQNTSHGTYDMFGSPYGHGFGQQARQDPPIDFRPAQRYATQRESVRSEEASSDATIDQGIGDSSIFDN